MRKLFYRRGFCATLRGDERPSVHLCGAAGSGGKQRKEKFQRYSFTETHQLEAGQNAGRQLPKSKGIIEYLKEGLLSKSLKTPFSSEVPHTPSCKPKGCDPGGSIASNTTQRQPPFTIIDQKLQSYTAPPSEVQSNLEVAF